MPTESKALPPKTVDAAGMPPRVRDILQQTLVLVRKALDGAVFRALEKFEWDVTNGSSTDDWMRDRGDHNLLIANRTSLLPRYMEGIEATLARIRFEEDPLNLRVRAKRFEPSSNWALESLSGKQTTFEESAFANVVLSASQLSVYLLGMRMGVLAGQPAMDPEVVPLGPKDLLDTFSDAVNDTFGEGFTAPKLLQRFHEELAPLYPRFIEQVNDLLGDEGILPGLTHMPIRKKAFAIQTEAPKSASPAWKSEASESTGGGRGGRGGSGGADGQSLGGYSNTASEQAAVSDWLGQPEYEGYLSRAIGGAIGDGGGGSGGAASPHPLRREADFIRMRQLLAAHRAAKGMDAMSHVAKRQEDELPRQAVHRAFDKIQDRTKGSVENLRQAGINSIEDLREHLLGELREEHGAEKGLSRVDADILDLFGLLYQALSGEVRDGSPMSVMLDRLQVPMARAALDDNKFFDESEHPGRKVLELVADSDARIAGESGVDPFFESAVEKAVTRIENTYRGETEILKSVSDELVEEPKQQVKRAEATEHRQIEAARGKERLLIARRETQAAMNALLEGVDLPGTCDNLVRTAWQDALSFVMLRNGAESDAWAQQKAVTERIIETVTADDKREDKELEIMVVKALRRVGYHESDANAVAELLSRGRQAPRSEFSPSPTAIAARIAGHARFGEEGDASEKQATQKAPRTQQEQANYELLREMPMGTWYDFVLNQQGSIERRRMSWYSSVSDRVLMVNRRGQRILDITLDDMARLMTVGQVQIAKHEDISVFSRAMHTVSGILSNVRSSFTRKETSA
jgi:hypothetical protein